MSTFTRLIFLSYLKSFTNYGVKICVYKTIQYRISINLQTQLSHGFPYSDRRSDYGGTIGVSGGGGGGGGGGGPGNRLHEHDPLALHQALQSSVDDGQHVGMDENVGFMSDLPMLKSKLNLI